jgi:hypothetical protein
MHDATKVLLGATTMSGKEVTKHAGSPATFKAGLAIRQKSDGTLSTTLADGQWLGVSLGKGLSDDTKNTSIARSGLGVPVLVEGGPARLVITITDYAALISGTDDTLQFEHAAEELDETLTFKSSESTEDDVAAETSNEVTATNLKNAINSHSVLGTYFIATSSGAVVTLTAIDNDLEGADFDVTYTDNDTNIGLTLDDTTFTGGAGSADYVTVGSKAYFSDTSGKADDPNSDSTVSDAVYVSGLLTGIDEDGNEVSVALVDMPGGL